MGNVFIFNSKIVISVSGQCGLGLLWVVMYYLSFRCIFLKEFVSGFAWFSLQIKSPAESFKLTGFPQIMKNYGIRFLSFPGLDKYKRKESMEKKKCVSRLFYFMKTRKFWISKKKRKTLCEKLWAESEIAVKSKARSMACDWTHTQGAVSPRVCPCQQNSSAPSVL